MDDTALLRLYVDRQSDEAFAALVGRHLNLVYSVAFRQVGNPHHAEEVTQAVFIILSKKAAQLRHQKALSSWLFQTTRLTAHNFVRSEMRRHRREQEAHVQSVLEQSGNDIWQRIAPLLDTAVARLSEQDRRAIVLRFYEGRNFREVAAAMEASEDAVEKRVSRSLEKLRSYFTRRGVVLSAGVLATAMAANSVQAAPATLALSITAGAAKGATVSGSTLTLIKGALKLMAWTKAKTAIIVGTGLLLAVGTTTITVREIEAHRTLALRMRVDGSDIINVSGNQLWIEHDAYLFPQKPIYVNGKPWSPGWIGNVSTRLTNLSPAFHLRDPRKVELAVKYGRGTVSLKQMPAPNNDQTLSFVINDKDYNGADWYEVVISW